MQRKVDLMESNTGEISTSTGSTVFASNSSAYGLKWDQELDTYRRTGNADFTQIQREMRRCVVSDSGLVNYYLDANDSTLKEDGTTASVLDGTDGQVMVEIPSFFYKVSGYGDVLEWSMSRVSSPGYKLHPAFMKAGKRVGKRYIGAYEADLVTDMLTSVSGTYPYCDQTITTLRDKANNRGADWHLQDYNLTFAIQMLIIVEYGTMNIQEALGMGRTELNDGSWADGSYYGQSGLSNVVGNGTGNVEYVGDADDAGAAAAYMSYRGIENLYGNVWNFVDGIKFLDWVPYVSDDNSDWGDTLSSSYIGSGVTQPSTNGYGKKLHVTDSGVFIADSTGTSSTGTTDYYSQSSGLRILLIGANAYDGLRSGPLFLFCNWSAAYSVAHVGSRIAR